jgi:hypothetical protein
MQTKSPSNDRRALQVLDSGAISQTFDQVRRTGDDDAR